jgi:hypothetical protein
MSEQIIGSEEKNVRNVGGGSFDLGLGIPEREALTTPPVFPDAGVQISVNPSTGFVEAWNNERGDWVNASPRLLYASFDGKLDDDILINQSVVCVIGSGTTFIGNTENIGGIDFIKPYPDREIVLLSGSFVPGALYLIIFGI